MKKHHVTNVNGCLVASLSDDRGLTGEHMCPHPEGHTWLHPRLKDKPVSSISLDEYGSDAVIACCSRCGTYRTSSPTKGHIAYRKPDAVSYEWVQSLKEENHNGNT